MEEGCSGGREGGIKRARASEGVRKSKRERELMNERAKGGRTGATSKQASEKGGRKGGKEGWVAGKDGVGK